MAGTTFTFAQPGLYISRVTITDPAGNRTVSTAVVQVLATAALDALLQGKWTNFKNALRTGDIPAALEFITVGTRGGYQHVFSAISSQLSAIDAILPPITPVETFAGSATYDTTRVDGGVTKAFTVRFVVDADGIWRIQSF